MKTGPLEPTECKQALLACQANNRLTQLVELREGLPFRQAVWLFPSGRRFTLEEAAHFADCAS
jgi:hypothetical protein